MEILSLGIIRARKQCEGQRGQGPVTERSMWSKEKQVKLSAQGRGWIETYEKEEKSQLLRSKNEQYWIR